MERATVRTSIGKSSPFRSWDCGGIIRSVSACSCGPRSRAERCPGSTVLRKEGGTMYLQQSHADAGVGLAYLLGRNGQVELGYHFTYFFQYEASHEDKNLFELIDNGVQARFTVRF